MTPIATLLFVEKFVTLTIVAGQALDTIVPQIRRLIDGGQITQDEVDAIIAAAAVSDQRFDDLLERLKQSSQPT